MPNERFNVEFTIEGSIEVLLPADATEANITKAAEKAVWDECRKARGTLLGDLQIGQYEGPFRL